VVNYVCRQCRWQHINTIMFQLLFLCSTLPQGTGAGSGPRACLDSPF
jgi:hypothetical protein